MVMAMATDGVPARRRYVRTDYAHKVATVQRVCRPIEAGENMTEVCRDPTMPQRSTLVAWLSANAELGAMVDDAQAQAALSFPQRRRHHRWSAGVAAEVLARIEDGRGLREVCAEPDMPAHCTVTRWLNERPDYAQAYRQARQAQADRLFDLAWRIALEATEAEVATARLKIQTLKWRVGKLAPRKYGPLKAQAPEESEGGGNGAGPVVRFEVRHFAVTPENRVVETTRAVRGMSGADQRALRDGIRSGAVSLDELEALARRADADLAGRS